MRSGTVVNSADYLAGRNDTPIALLYDTGLRVGEAIRLAVDLLHLDDVDPYIALPTHIQKDPLIAVRRTPRSASRDRPYAPDVLEKSMA